MLCLLAWGSILEKHISILQYLLVYAVTLIGAGLVGIHTHVPPFLVVGAQGAVGGVFGALLCLSVLGRIPLPLTFFVAALALNLGFAFVLPKADWSMAAGGFAVGLLVGGLLGILARLTDKVLRCKFPEWVKLELTLLFAFGAYAVWATGAVKLSLTDVRGGLLILGCALIVIKLVDLILYMKRGLAVIALLFAATCAVAPVVMKSTLLSAVARQCISMARPASNAAFPGDGSHLIGPLHAGLCAHPSFAVYAVAALAFVIAIIIHVAPLRRGFRDVGFVGPGFRGERKQAVA
jgi:rhomboid protease GluP